MGVFNSKNNDVYVKDDDVVMEVVIVLNGERYFEIKVFCFRKLYNVLLGFVFRFYDLDCSVLIDVNCVF